MEMIKFERQIEKHFDGGSQLFPFQKDWHEAALRFRKDLADTRPILTLQDPRKLGEPRYSCDLTLRSISGTPTPVGKATMAAISIDSDDEDGAPSFEPSPIRQSGKKRPNSSAQSTPAKVPRVNGASRFTSPQHQNALTFARFAVSYKKATSVFQTISTQSPSRG